MKYLNGFNHSFESDQIMVIKRTQFNKLKKLVSKAKSNIGDESTLTDVLLELQKLIEKINASC